ncbi:transcriptional regulatory protein-like protein [Candidatus Koribacter versatilis Ellin345]|uniref:Transcriptional regulatory protein-like protein n=2 Tax=Candidatus Korobacter versatilis TaxID=658062 RepID=Q1IIR6_KORVE|nr:transcriptional regulatory protein-like protein [Candidatus Koribacter versatilis Ellin345]
MTDLIGPNRLRFGPYEADLHTRELWKFGTRVKLVGQPFDILELLISRPGELVTRDELRERLWPKETFVDFNHGLNAAVNKLRDVLCDSADDPKFIETLPRRGYRFISKVERGVEEPIPVAETSPPTPLVVPTPAELAPEPRYESPAITVERSLGRTKWSWGAAALLMVVIAFIAFLAISKISREPSESEKKASMGGQGAAIAGLVKGVQVTLVTGGKNEGPQFSPDGKRLTFMSNRNGATDVWIANASGSDPHPLTTLGDAGTPRWSPDGQTIAFDSHIHKYSAILTIPADGGAPRVLIAGDSNNSVPSWSKDGHFIYFASDRTGRFEVWRVPTTGGPAQQITQDGGFAPVESADGKLLFYAKNQFPNPEVWEVSLEGGGVEAPLRPIIRPVTWATWAVAGDSVFYVEEGPGNIAMLSVVEPKARRMRQVTVLGRFPFWLAISPDGRKLAFDRTDSESTTSIVALEDFE